MWCSASEESSGEVGTEGGGEAGCRGTLERMKKGGCSAQSTRAAAGCYNNSISLLSLSDHPLIVCSLLSFGAPCLSITPPPPPFKKSTSPLLHLHVPRHSFAQRKKEREGGGPSAEEQIPPSSSPLSRRVVVALCVPRRRAEEQSAGVCVKENTPIAPVFALLRPRVLFHRWARFQFFVFVWTQRPSWNKLLLFVWKALKHESSLGWAGFTKQIKKWKFKLLEAFLTMRLICLCL